MATVDGRYVPDTEQEARNQGWNPMASLFGIPDFRTGQRIQKTCRGKPAGSLCDAYVRTGDNKVQAVYCDGNNCTHMYESP